MSFGERLKEARTLRGLTQKQLAEKLNIGSTTVTGYEKDNSEPNMLTISKIMEILEVDANYLFQDETRELYKNEASPEEFENIIKKYRLISEYSPDGKIVIDTVIDREYAIAEKLKDQDGQIKKMDMEVAEEIVPVRIISYYQRLASAGNGQVVFDDIDVERIEIPDIPKYKRVSYAIGVNGHSMEPLFNNGDILLIETTCQVEVGEIGIFIVDGEAFVKKLGNDELISLNKGYGNIPLTEYSNCMGRVVDKLNRD